MMLHMELVACHAYRSDDPRHLSFPIGARILAKPGQDGNPLWLGSFAGRTGWFPPSYCRMQPVWPSSQQQQQRALRTLSLDHYDFAQRRRPAAIERRSKSVEESKMTGQQRVPPIQESCLVPPKTPTDHVKRRAKARFEASAIFDKVNRFVEELEQSSELSLPDHTLSSSQGNLNGSTSYRNAANGEENLHGLDRQSREMPVRASPSRSRPRRPQLLGSSWLQGIKDMRNTASTRKIKKAGVVPRTMLHDPSSQKVLSNKKSRTANPKAIKTDKVEQPVRHVEDPIDPIEVLAAEFRARQALAPL